MGKSNGSINPADALRKKQRKRELKKNKEERKRARESVLAKKDINKVKSEISRLEHLASSGQLSKQDQARLDNLKAEASKIEKAKKNVGSQLTGAQAAYLARMQEQERKHEGESRKLVYDPKSGKFVPAKKKDATTSKRTAADQGDEDEDETTGSESETDTSSDTSDTDSIGSIEGIETEEDENEEDQIPLPESEQKKEENKKKELTESDDEYEIPLPPGPPPPKPFASQVPPQAYGGRVPPPPPPLPSNYQQLQQQQQQPYMAYPQYYYPQPHYPQPQHSQYQAAPVTYSSSPVKYNSQVKESNGAKEQPKKPVVATISAEPQLRDLQKELLGFVPASVRRKQVKANKNA
ncbi:unnamed protein product [Rhizopus microsporus]